MAESLALLAATLAGGIAVSWMGWVSVTLIRILQGTTSNNERISDLERRVEALER